MELTDHENNDKINLGGSSVRPPKGSVLTGTGNEHVVLRRFLLVVIHY